MPKKDLQDFFELLNDLTGPRVPRPVRWCGISGTPLGFAGGLIGSLLIDVSLYVQGAIVALAAFGGLVFGLVVGILIESILKLTRRKSQPTPPATNKD
jgi:hypothetical protein